MERSFVLVFDERVLLTDSLELIPREGHPFRKGALAPDHRRR